jgi:hypothetical protein
MLCEVGRHSEHEALVLDDFEINAPIRKLVAVQGPRMTIRLDPPTRTSVSMVGVVQGIGANRFRTVHTCRLLRNHPDRS